MIGFAPLKPIGFGPHAPIITFSLGPTIGPKTDN
jgi:hypothetical protein